MSSDFFIQKNLYSLIKNILESAFIINHYIEAYKDILHFLYVIFRCEIALIKLLRRRKFLRKSRWNHWIELRITCRRSLLSRTVPTALSSNPVPIPPRTSRPLIPRARGNAISQICFVPAKQARRRNVNLRSATTSDRIGLLFKSPDGVI